MARRGPAVITVSIQASPGGTVQQIKNFVQNGITAKDMSIIADRTPVGVDWMERTPIGVRDSEPVTIQGDFDDTATTGSHAIFQIAAADVSPDSAGREIVVNYGGRTWTRSVHVESYAVMGTTTDIQKFEVVLSPTGAAVWS